MPTFTTIALENLLEHRKPDSNSSTFKHPLPSITKPTNDLNQNQEFQNSRKPLNHVFISPSLYTTPEPTPILDYSSSGSVSSSPYVFNRKGRGGGGGGVGRKIDGFEVENRDGNEKDLVVGGGESENCDDGIEEEVDEFVDPRCDSLSVASSSEFNDPGRLLLGSENVTHVGEFYDAIEGMINSFLYVFSPNL